MTECLLELCCPTKSQINHTFKILYMSTRGGGMSSTGDHDQVTVFFSSSPNANPYHELLTKNLDEHGVETINEPLPLLFPITRTIIENDSIDVVHLDWLYQFFIVESFTPFNILNTLITVSRAVLLCVDLLLAKLLGVQLVWTVHNKYHHERKYYRTEWCLNILVANIVDDISVKCHTAKDIVADIYRVRTASKITAIPDGNYIEAYPNSITQSEARERLDVNSECVFLFFGHIRPYKGVDRLIEKFKELPNDDVSLLVAGKPINREIRERISMGAAEDDRITATLEMIPEEEVQYYMNAADFFVLPYRDILNSGSVHLGLSFGKPIIAPKLGCIPDTVSPDSGLLYEPDDEEGLRKTLEVALNIDDVERMQDASYHTAEQKPWGRAAEQYVKLYEE